MYVHGCMSKGRTENVKTSGPINFLLRKHCFMCVYTQTICPAVWEYFRYKFETDLCYCVVHFVALTEQNVMKCNNGVALCPRTLGGD